MLQYYRAIVARDHRHRLAGPGGLLRPHTVERDAVDAAVLAAYPDIATIGRVFAALL